MYKKYRATYFKQILGVKHISCPRRSINKCTSKSAFFIQDADLSNTYLVYIRVHIRMRRMTDNPGLVDVNACINSSTPSWWV